MSAMVISLTVLLSFAGSLFAGRVLLGAVLAMAERRVRTDR